MTEACPIMTEACLIMTGLSARNDRIIIPD